MNSLFLVWLNSPNSTSSTLMTLFYWQNPKVSMRLFANWVHLTKTCSLLLISIDYYCFHDGMSIFWIFLFIRHLLICFTKPHYVPTLVSVSIISWFCQSLQSTFVYRYVIQSRHKRTYNNDVSNYSIIDTNNNNWSQLSF